MGLMRLTQETKEVSPDTSVMEAVRSMTANKTGALAVIAPGRAGPQIVGIFTERDLMRRVVHEGRDPGTTSIREVMTSPVQTVSDSTSVSEAANRMRTHHIRHLAIVDGEGVFRGMLALRYLLYDMLDDLARKVEGLQSEIMADGPGG
ncbi:MAG: CBS domain-containing protein [Bacteroidota bacterium]